MRLIKRSDYFLPIVDGYTVRVEFFEEFDELAGWDWHNPSTSIEFDDQEIAEINRYIDANVYDLLGGLHEVDLSTLLMEV